MVVFFGGIGVPVPVPAGGATVETFGGGATLVKVAGQAVTVTVTTDGCAGGGTTGTEVMTGGGT